MTARPPRPLATGPRRMRLLSFHPAPGCTEDARFPDAPVGCSLVALWHGDRALMVYERERACWELPGGGIEPGERPREAAVRELWEETGQRVPPEALRFVGHAQTSLGLRRHVLYSAVFTARVERRLPFTPNAEISAVHWRRGLEPMPGGGRVQTVDEYLLRLCRTEPGAGPQPPEDPSGPAPVPRQG